MVAWIDGEHLCLPAGESTTMALIAERWGLIPDLKEFVGQGKPIWGTCAGLIFLADRSKGSQAHNMSSPLSCLSNDCDRHSCKHGLQTLSRMCKAIALAIYLQGTCT